MQPHCLPEAKHRKRIFAMLQTACVCSGVYAAHLFLCPFLPLVFIRSSCFPLSCPLPHQRAFLFIRQRYMGVVEMKEFRLPAFALKKITMLSATAPTFFSFKTFLIPLSQTSISRKKKAQTQLGNKSLKKSQRIQKTRERKLSEKKV